jgi:putative transposase
VGQDRPDAGDRRRRWPSGQGVGDHRLGFYFATEPDGFFTTDKVIEFLKDLLKHLRGPVIVVWDRGNNHKGPLMREFLKTVSRLHLEMLPPWAPELNPAEPVWSWLKHGELANYIPDDTDMLDHEILDRLISLKFDSELLRALWNRSDLPFPAKLVQELCLPPMQ